MKREELEQAFEKKETGKWKLDREVFKQCENCLQGAIIPANQEKVICIICGQEISRES